jgi:hypothetical protein
MRKVVRETKVKCEVEPGSWVNYFQKLLKKDVPGNLVIEPGIMKIGKRLETVEQIRETLIEMKNKYPL